MPDEHGWFGPEDGLWKAKCNACGEIFMFRVTEGGGPAYHPHPNDRESYDVEIIGPVDELADEVTLEK